MGDEADLRDLVDKYNERVTKKWKVAAVTLSALVAIYFLVVNPFIKEKPRKNQLEIKAEQIMQDYDTNKDGKLNPIELTNILRDYKIVKQ